MVDFTFTLPSPKDVRLNRKQTSHGPAAAAAAACARDTQWWYEAMSQWYSVDYAACSGGVRFASLLSYRLDSMDYRHRLTLTLHGWPVADRRAVLVRMWQWAMWRNGLTGRPGQRLIIAMWRDKTRLEQTDHPRWGGQAGARTQRTGPSGSSLATLSHLMYWPSRLSVALTAPNAVRPTQTNHRLSALRCELKPESRIYFRGAGRA